MVWCWSKHPLKCMTLVGVFTSSTRQVLRPDIPLGRLRLTTLHCPFLGLVPNKWGSVIGLHPCTGRSEQQLEMRNERLMLLGVRNAVLLIGFGHPGTHTPVGRECQLHAAGLLHSAGLQLAWQRP